MPIDNPLVPVEMLVLMKKLAYSVLKEKPENIPLFAADFFDKLIIERDGKLHKGYERFAAYDESIQKRKSVDLVKEVPVTEIKSTQKLVVPNAYDDDDEVFLSNKSGNVSKFDAVKPPKAKPRKLSSKKPSESLISITEETSIEVREFYTKQEKYRNAAMKIQAAFRKYLENKKNNQENEKIMQNAALVLQKLFKSFIQKRRDEKAGQIQTSEKIETEAADKTVYNEVSDSTVNKAEEMPNLEDPEVADAAIKIQKAFRGHLEHKNQKMDEIPQSISNHKEAENDKMPKLEDPEVVDAAIKIQKAFRGHLEHKSNTNENHPPIIIAPEINEEMINLEDPDVADAEIKIQKAYHGHFENKSDTNTEKPSHSTIAVKEDDMPSLDDPEVANAAIKIQTAFRSHLKERVNKEEEPKVIDIKEEISKLSTETPAEEMPNLADPEVVDAAVRIQKAFRGHLENKELKLPAIEVPIMIEKADMQVNSNQNDVMPDLNDREVEEAASKIQKAFRSHVARKDNANEEISKKENADESNEITDQENVVLGAEALILESESLSEKITQTNFEEEIKKSLIESIDDAITSASDIVNKEATSELETDLIEDAEVAETLIENSVQTISKGTQVVKESESEANKDEPTEENENIRGTETKPEEKTDLHMNEFTEPRAKIGEVITDNKADELKETYVQDADDKVKPNENENSDDEEDTVLSPEDKAREELKAQKLIEGIIKFQKIYRGYIARKNLKKQTQETALNIPDMENQLPQESGTEAAESEKLISQASIAEATELAKETKELVTKAEISESVDEEKLSKAASVIQKSYRSYKLRQIKSQKLIEGVIKFQRIYRGYIKRRNLEKQEKSAPSETEISKINSKSLDSELKQQSNAGPINSKDDIENNLDNKEIIAAINIQRIYRGYKVRRDKKNENLNKERNDIESVGNKGEDDLKRQITVEEEPCIKQIINVLGPDLSEITEFPESTDNETAPSTAEADSYVNNFISEESEIPNTESSENETTHEIEKITHRIISENSEIPVTETSESDGNSTTDEFSKRDEDYVTTGTEVLSDADFKNDTVLSKVSELPSATDDETNKTEIASSDDEFIKKVLTESNDGFNVPENETESSENFLKVTGSPDVENGSLNRRNSSASPHNQLEARLKNLRDQESLKYEQSQSQIDTDSTETETNEIPYERLQQSIEGEELDNNEISSREDEHTRISHQELKEIEDFDISNYEKDSLEAMYYSLKKNEVLLDKMHRRASLERSTDFGVQEIKQDNEDDDKDVTLFGDEVSFEPDSLNYSTNDFTDNSLGKIDEEREESSSDGSDKRALKIILDDNRGSLDVKIPGEVEDEFLNPIQYALKKSEEMKKQLHETETVPITPEFDTISTSYQEQNFEPTIEEDDYVEELGAPKSVRKFLASAASEADSDYVEPNRTKSVLFSDDFNISTALKSTSTDSESTINSAATKIQAGARGFLTRRRLHGSSKQSKDRPSSFGNAAIDKSLEDMIEQKEKDNEMEEAALKIQTKYRSYRERQQLLQQNRTTLQETMDYSDEEVRGITEIKLEQKKMNDSTSVESTDSNNISDEKYSGHPTIITVDANSDDKSSEDDVNQFKNSHLLSSLNFDELDTAARRSLYSITRDDAIQLSTPSDENEIDRSQTGDITQFPASEEKQGDFFVLVLVISF